MVDEDISLRSARRFLKNISLVFKDYKPKEPVKPLEVQTVKTTTTIVTRKKAKKSQKKRRCMTKEEIRKDCDIDKIIETLNKLIGQNEEIKDFIKSNIKLVSSLEKRVERLEKIKNIPVQKKETKASQATSKPIKKSPVKIKTKKEIVKVEAKKQLNKKVPKQKTTEVKTTVKTTITKEEKTVSAQEKPKDPEMSKRIEQLERQYEHLKEMGYDPFYLNKIEQRIINLKKSL